jgi:hypothetical protein
MYSFGPLVSRVHFITNPIMKFNNQFKLATNIQDHFELI